MSYQSFSPSGLIIKKNCFLFSEKTLQRKQKMEGLNILGMTHAVFAHSQV